MDQRTPRQLLFLEEVRRGRFPNATSFARLLSRRATQGIATPQPVSAKTILRDIEHLQLELAAPLDYDACQHGYALTDLNWQLPLARLHGDSCFSALFAAQLPGPCAGPVQSALDVAKAVQLRIGNPDEFDPDLLSALVLSAGARVAIDPAVFDVVRDAWQLERRLRLRYCDGRGKQSCREADVHALFLADGAWYARAFCHLRQEQRSFALHRIVAPELLTQGFTREQLVTDSVRCGDIFDRELVHKILVFCTPEKAPIIRERQWFPGQVITPCGEGALELFFPQAPRPEFVWWILSYGGHLVVRQPAPLRQEIYATARHLARTHGDDHNPPS